MIVKHKESNKFGLVVAIRNNEYCVAFNNVHFPYFYALDELTIVDSWVPDEWITRENDGVTLTSYTDWANDKTYYSALDETHSREYMRYQERVEAYTAEMARNIFGSIEKATLALTEHNFSKLVADYRERGFELPDQNNSTITKIELDSILNYYADTT